MGGVRWVPPTVVIPGYTQLVKTAVSIPDAIFEAADALARERRVSRSALYAEALQLLLAATSGDEVTEQLDAVHDDGAVPIDPTVTVANTALFAEPW